MWRPKRRRRVNPMQIANEFCRSGKDQVGFYVKEIDEYIGRGLFTNKTFNKGDFLLEYKGIAISESAESNSKYIYYFKHNGQTCCIDGENSSGLCQFANDDWRSPNATMKKVVIDNIPHLCLFAVHDIKAHVEIRYDYNDNSSPWRQKSGIFEKAEDIQNCDQAADTETIEEENASNTATEREEENASKTATERQEENASETATETIEEENASNTATERQEENASKTATEREEDNASKTATEREEENASKTATEREEENASETATETIEEENASETATETIEEENASGTATEREEENASDTAAETIEKENANETATETVEENANETATEREEENASEAATEREENASEAATETVEEENASEAATEAVEENASDAATDTKITPPESDSILDLSSDMIAEKSLCVNNEVAEQLEVNREILEDETQLQPDNITYTSAGSSNEKLSSAKALLHVGNSTEEESEESASDSEPEYVPADDDYQSDTSSSHSSVKQHQCAAGENASLSGKQRIKKRKVKPKRPCPFCGRFLTKLNRHMYINSSQTYGSGERCSDVTQEEADASFFVA